MKTAVVILNWNGEKHLKRFLAPLLHSIKGYDAEVTIADNNSIDGSVRYVENCFEGRVPVLCFPKNYGFAEGYNRALATLQAKYYLLLNSDVLVEGDWLYALEEWMDLHEDCAACGPKILSYQERDRFEYAGAAGGLIDDYGYTFCRGRILQYTEKDEGQYELSAGGRNWRAGASVMSPAAPSGTSAAAPSPRTPPGNSNSTTATTCSRCGKTKPAHGLCCTCMRPFLNWWIWKPAE